MDKKTESDRKSGVLELYKGLKALGKGVFPKKCASCGAIYADMDEFLNKTSLVFDKSGLAETPAEDFSPAVGLYRNCACGSTLFLVCGNRRDLSEAGLKKRATFQQMMDALVELGLQPETARRELLNVVRSGRSEALDAFLDLNGPAKNA